MPRLRRYRIFISHSWDYHEYGRIREFLDSTTNFLYSDYSVPRHNSLTARSTKELKEALRRLIGLSQIVLVPAGMEITYRLFIGFELKVAADMDKPIVGIIPRGSIQIPRAIDVACDTVGWNRLSIVNAIRRYAL
jgi:hypothetical protein